MLKVMYLNTWGGTKPLWNELQRFITRHRDYVDIFCFQEVHHTPGPLYSGKQWVMPKNPGHRIGPIHTHQHGVWNDLVLKDSHFGFFTPFADHCLTDLERIETRPTQFGLAMYVRRNLSVAGFRSQMIYRRFDDLNENGRPAARAIQIATVVHENRTYLIGNFHGLWTGKGKGDCRERSEQSVRIYEALEGARKQARTDTPHDVVTILGGDFNLTADTEAFRLIQNSSAFGIGGGLSLNKTHGITDTRTEHYPPDRGTRQADFVIVSPELGVDTFRIITDPIVSDHTPIMVQFE